VGVTKDNVDYLDDFDHAEHGDNVFSIQQVKDATNICIKIRNDIEAINKDISDNVEPYVPEQDDTVWPDAKA
jgi:glycine cleavage system H lipoate-binding protein